MVPTMESMLEAIHQMSCELKKPYNFCNIGDDPSLKAQIMAAHAALRRCMDKINFQTPIFRLPSEIIGFIFYPFWKQSG